MRSFSLASIASAMALALCLCSGNAMAQASRTWVSGVGDDANPCSRTAPCKTLPGAISKTAVGGEIDALDPGGFGALTITKSITIDGGGGQVASVLVAGTNGIVVSAPANSTVIIRNLRINGVGGVGINGIRFNTGGTLYVENCDIFGFSGAGIDVEPSGTTLTYVSNTSTVNNGNGGVLVKPLASATAKAVMFGARADLNSAGFVVDSTGGAGAVATMTISRSSATMNGTGVLSNGGSATVLIGSSHIVLNGTGVSSTNSGAVQSNKNNEINLNTTDGTPVTAASGPLN